ncbi:sortase [Streptomyces sp. NPDC020883]|uniref:sortase n=1 Tax=Streptomyces sp. NPDC020883 TaxID=3365099 RepID=UPI00379E9633
MPDTSPPPEAPNNPHPNAPAPSRRRRNILIAAALTAVAGLALTAALTLPQADSRPADAKATTPSITTSAAPRPTISSQPTPTGTKAVDHTRHAATQAHGALENWRKNNTADPGTDAVAGAAGQVQEVLRIPMFGSSWAQPVYEGTGASQLRAGVGHFIGTEQPGQVGNFALAGHRSGVETPPFQDVEHLTAGARILVTTAHRITYTYTVAKVYTAVDPDRVDFIAQVPGSPNAVPTKAQMTIVTCWPAQGHAKRDIVVAQLTGKAGGV